MLHRPSSSPPGAFAVLIAAWIACTFVASLAGSSFVRAASDCLTPALLAQAATAAFHATRGSALLLRRKPADVAAQGASSSAHPGHRAWVLALGLLQLMASVLTLASFGLSSVAFTYIIRTLEPLCSCLLLCLLHQRPCGASELLLLALVAAGTCCVAGAGGGGPGAAAASASAVVDAPATLAFVATLVVSCRSVASKTVAALTDVPEFDSFLESAAPGLVAGAVLQAGLWALFGVAPLQGLHAAGWPAAPLGSLLACAAAHAAYNAASFKVLQRCSPVVHGALNVSKRVAIIVASALLAGRPLGPLQLLGVVAANAAAAALLVQQSAAAAGRVVPLAPRASREGAARRPSLSATAATAAAAAAASDKAGLIRARPPSWSGGLGAAAAVRLLTRLVYVIACVMVCGAVCTAYVIAALGAPRGSGQELHGAQQQQERLDHEALAWPTLLLSSGNNASGASGVGVGGVSAGGLDADLALAASAQLFALRDAQRVKCLTDLHHVSKTSLAPLLGPNAGAGGVALFDVALHKNLGDAVLWAAAARLVPEFHRAVRYVCALSQFPGRGAEARKHFPKCSVKHAAQAVGRGGVVLLAPGGNWGDLWWFVHSQRLQYLREMTGAAAAMTAASELRGEEEGRRSAFQVVQLPQSISFSSPDKAAADARVVNAMPPGMLTLFARQAASLDYARRRYPNATVLPGPDLAFSLGPLMPGDGSGSSSSSSSGGGGSGDGGGGDDAPPVDVLILLRHDKEAAGSEAAGVQAHKAAPGGGGRNGSSSGGGGGGGRGNGLNSSSSVSEAAAALALLEASGLTYEMREWEFAHENYTREVSRVALVQVAESRLQGAVDIISRGKVVLTNRLHAAIVANLVGRPLLWIDTKQGKLSGVRELAFSYSPACTESNLHSQQAGSFKEAVATAVEWLTSPDFVWSTQQLPPLHA